MENFEQEGVVSVWVFREAEDPADADKDVLRDFCGVDYYDIDFQEGITATSPQSLASLLSQLSYASSFIEDALNTANRLGIEDAYGVIVQFDFAYDPSTIARQISPDPVFIGHFSWHD